MRSREKTRSVVTGTESNTDLELALPPKRFPGARLRWRSRGLSREGIAENYVLAVDRTSEVVILLHHSLPQKAIAGLNAQRRRSTSLQSLIEESEGM